MENKGKLLGIDFGAKNVGLAVTDESRQFVFGRGCIENYPNLGALFEQIQEVCEAERISGIVMGVPLDENMEETARTKEYREVGVKLEVFFEGKMKVHFQDEAFSTFEGGEAISDPDLKKKYNSHELAAMVILERFIGA
ncbi:MAG: RuvX/YqgF family protein [Candidatus Gracilibacteria bacterium]